jgi:phosphoglycerate dehydrogenase-like enzyme
MKILAYDQYPDLNFAKRLNLQYCDTIKELLPQIDFLTIHTPLTKDTTNLIDAKCLALMKPQAIIVNCARGGIVNEQALYEALKNNKIAGAGLDVFTEEPVDPNNPLLSLDNFISGTHNAGTSLEGKNNVVKSAVQSVIDYHAGERPFGIINPEVLTLKN